MLQAGQLLFGDSTFVSRNDSLSCVALACNNWSERSHCLSFLLNFAFNILEAHYTSRHRLLEPTSGQQRNSTLHTALKASSPKQSFSQSQNTSSEIWLKSSSLNSTYKFSALLTPLLKPILVPHSAPGKHQQWAPNLELARPASSSYRTLIIKCYSPPQTKSTPSEIHYQNVMSFFIAVI